MEVFRISKKAYSGALSSSGTAGRWNLRRQQLIYTGSSRSLASLELVVHKGVLVPTEKYRVMVISIADDDYLVKHLQIKDLPPNWRTFDAYPILQNHFNVFGTGFKFDIGRYITQGSANICLK